MLPADADQKHGIVTYESNARDKCGKGLLIRPMRGDSLSVWLTIDNQMDAGSRFAVVLFAWYEHLKLL